MTKCSRCGEINDEGFRFCRSCGRALVAEPASDKPRAADVAAARPAEPARAPAAAEPHGAGAFKLVATAGLLSGRTFSIGPKGLSIGRDPLNCQVVIADEEVSRLHAWVGVTDRGEVTIRDCHSVNGTFVNDARIQEHQLESAEEFSVGTSGHHRFRVEGVRPVRPSPLTQTDSQQEAPGAGETSVLSPRDLFSGSDEAGKANETVALKLTGLMARAHVELIVDKYAVQTLEIPPEGLLVGRDAGRCQLVMDHPSVSAIHAEFSPVNGKVLLVDRSTNGTFVDGSRVSGVELELHDGDYITFGRYAGKSLIFRTGLEPELRHEVVDLDKERITIGRDPTNDLHINHPLVSKRHAEIVREGGKTTIVDLGSTNGTFVNGLKVKRHELHEMDRIVIGPSELRFTGAGLSRSTEAQVVRLDASAVTLEVSGRVTGQPCTLLDGVSLVVKPRELIGLLGPSGAGKTTLMRTLNGFLKPTRGRVLYNGADLYQNLSSLKSTIGFVPQEDIVHSQLSVRRCLYYAARLRLPEDLSESELSRRLDEMLGVLKIDPSHWNLPVAKLSGGQRKRVSIGIELLSKPGVLFLDEPTAGLDPRTETLMMMLFRQLANQGSTLIITTHLLASFGVLDKVVVLLQGRLAFYGPGNKLLEYFQAEAPPDIYDDLTDNNTQEYALELKKRFAASPLYRQWIAEPLAASAALQSEPTVRSSAMPPPDPAGPAPSAPSAGTKPEPKRFSLHQFKVLAQRNWELKFSDRSQTLLLLLQAPVVAMIVALMADGSNQVQTIFMAMFAALWFGCSNAVREIVDEQTIYRRERQTGLMIPSYIGSKLAVLGALDFIQCLSVIVVLLFVNQALSLSAGEVLGALLILFLVAVDGSLIGLLISGLVNSPDKALALFPLALIPELLLAGLFMPVNRVQPMIPITVGQLMEGKLDATPEAKAQVERAMPAIPPGTPGAPSSKKNPARRATKSNRLEHQVAGAIEPSPDLQNALRKYTTEPEEGMGTITRTLSLFAVSRWGFEALADLCLHGAHSTQDSAYKIINTVSISLHPRDVDKLKSALEAPAPAAAGQERFPLPAHFWSDEGPYLAILAGFMVAMTALVLYLMKRKDVS
ncbi:MAG: FHA domain-containing protein [Terriglobia bacterium]